jgi:hypothetical protein
MPLKLLSTGGGSVLLTANTTGSDFTVNVPPENGTMFTSASLPVSVANGGTGRSNPLAYCFAYNSADTSVFAYSTAVKVAFNTAGLDNVSGFNAANNRYVVQSGYAGIYRVDFNCRLRLSTGSLMNNAWWMIYKNGSQMSYNQLDTNGRYFYSIPCIGTYIANLAVGDYLEFYVGFDSQSDTATRSYFTTNTAHMFVQQIG